jgi:P-type conjugative transfer protein TrbJ
MQVQSLTNAASLLSGNSGSIISRLNSISAYSNQLSATGYNLGNIGNQFTIWQQTLGSNAQTMGRTLGLQQQQLASNASIEQAIQQHSTSATGQMQAIQAGNELAAANGEVLNQMAQTLIAQAQMAQTASLADADRRASEDAAMLHFSTYSPIAATGSQGF